MDVCINNSPKKLKAFECQPFTLLVGVICGSLAQIKPLLNDIDNLASLSFLNNIEVYVLANGERTENVDTLLKKVFSSSGSPAFRVLNEVKIGRIIPISHARSRLQKAVGIRMSELESVYAWILDDDMRIPQDAKEYLTWLPAFKLKGVDALIGTFNGSSPNPPAHGLRVQVNDLVQNLEWFRSLASSSELPDRSKENSYFRSTFPDYYYDLSRKHRQHLDKAYWVIPEFKGETVEQARNRVLSSLDKILTGEPFFRPLINSTSNSPLSDSQPSCNRGGNTFILNYRLLTLTPNATFVTNGEVNRRSDMIWAIINTYHHKFIVHFVSFPVYHHRFVNCSTDINLDKTISEVRGAAMYAAMVNFFEDHPGVNWGDLISNFNEALINYSEYLESRINAYKDNFMVIETLLEILESENNEDINSFIFKVRSWINDDNLCNFINKIKESSNTVCIKEFINQVSKQIELFK